LPALLGMTLLAGCSREYSEKLRYPFKPHPIKVAPSAKAYVGDKLDAKERKEIADKLEEYFGTPRYPAVVMDEPMQKELLLTDALLAKDTNRDVDSVLEEGSRLYRQHCLYCHGLSGDASGPTGQFLNPLPRDFRQGKFKFRSTAKKKGNKFDTTDASALASRDDLKKTIRNGVPTASMPSFTLLPDDQLDALVSYVIHLSLRGQVEYQLALQGVSSADPAEELNRVAKKWIADNKSPYVPPEAPKKLSWNSKNGEESWKRGRQLYVGSGGCYKCHGEDGRSSVAELVENETMKNDWGDLIVPRNLTLGVYRGGSRPLDLYYRIRLGIAVSGMPAANLQELSDEDVWYVVDYIMSMPRVPAGEKKPQVAHNPERNG
jgi:mono/diheme cytochrome c family protein